MVSLSEEPIESLAHVNLDLVHCQLPVADIQLVLRHVDIELFEVLLDFPNLLPQIELLVIELDIVVVLDVPHKALNQLLKLVHLLAQSVLLPDVVLPRLIKRIVVSLKEALNLGLMLVELLQCLLLLSYVTVLELDDLFLELVARLRQHVIVMALMRRQALAAIEGLIDLAAVLDLSVLVLLAEEALRCVLEILKLVKHPLLKFLLLGPRHELFERLCRVVLACADVEASRGLQSKV